LIDALHAWRSAAAGITAVSKIGVGAGALVQGLGVLRHLPQGLVRGGVNEFLVQSHIGRGATSAATPKQDADQAENHDDGYRTEQVESKRKFHGRFRLSKRGSQDTSDRLSLRKQSEAAPTPLG
jgi:hypothetical protein